ncbi:uncharacterized protein METZ01_LOCUS420126, partial [marine metagenome]
GGAIKNASIHLDSEFFVINGDSLFDINYEKLVDLLSTEANALVAIALRETSDVSRFGCVINDGLYVTGFTEKSLNNISGLINGGVYLMKKEVLDFISEGRSSLEEDWFPKLAQRKKLLGRRLDGYFIDIGVTDDFERSQIELPAWERGLLKTKIL